MRPLTLNLARRPFANSRPLARATLLFWLIGGVFFALNVLFYWQHFSGEGQSERVMRDIASRIEVERSTIVRLEGEVADLDLAGQNQLVTFLNQKIAERTFSWSSLFDDLAEVLPEDVQLERVTPKVTGRANPRRPRNRRASREEVDEVVALSLNGRAKSGEKMLALVDALFEHPSFREPSPNSETRREESTELSFSLSVFYLPRRPVEGATAPEPLDPEVLEEAVPEDEVPEEIVAEGEMSPHPDGEARPEVETDGGAS